jgi:phosphoribosylanthranilate isomerase
MQRTGIKFCGLTRRDDIDAALDAGADYLGLVMAEDSPRYVTIATASELARHIRVSGVPAQLVVLFRDASRAYVDEAIEHVAPDILQFHGSETESTCVVHRRPYWKAVGMHGGDAPVDWNLFATASALLLDAHGKGAAGGTGEVFDWSQWPCIDRRLVLAGGLHPDNVAEAIRATRPYAVDVSSGIESRPGMKDPGRMRAFVAAVRAVDSAGTGNGKVAAATGPD